MGASVVRRDVAAAGRPPNRFRRARGLDGPRRATSSRAGPNTPAIHSYTLARQPDLPLDEQRVGEQRDEADPPLLSAYSQYGSRGSPPGSRRVPDAGIPGRHQWRRRGEDELCRRGADEQDEDADEAGDRAARRVEQTW